MLINSVRQQWLSLGTMDATAGAADAVLGVAERTLAIAGALDNAVYKAPLPQMINAIEVGFIMTTNGANAVMDVWAGRLKGGNADLCRVCTLDVECGTQDVMGSSTLHYADEIIITNNNWIKTVYAIQSGNDSEQMARLVFDLCGYDVVLFHGHTTFEEDCLVGISGF